MSAELPQLAESYPYLENTHSFADALFVGLLFSLDRILNDMGEAGKSVRNRFMHRFLHLRDELFSDDGEAAPVREWLSVQAYNSIKTGFSMYKPQWARIPLVLRSRSSRRTSDRRESTLGDFDAEMNTVSDNVRLLVSEQLATVVLEEAVTSVKPSLSRHSTLVRVSLDLSNRYCTVLIEFSPGKRSRRELVGSEVAFLRYAATRRGLVVPASA